MFFHVLYDSWSSEYWAFCLCNNSLIIEHQSAGYLIFVYFVCVCVCVCVCVRARTCVYVCVPCAEAMLPQQLEGDKGQE
jgi:hypothetical protein